MSDVENTPVVDSATEGATSPTAAVSEVVTATTEETPNTEVDGSREKSKRDTRLAELAYEAREAKRQAKAADEARVDLERQLEEARAGKGGAPKVESFESYDEYLREMTRWEVRQEMSQHSRKQTEEAQKAKQLEAQSRKAGRLESVMTDGADTYKDFDATLRALDSAIANPDDFRVGLDEILDSDTATDILYYLGKNPSEAVAIAALPPHKQARAIGSLEQKFKDKKLTAAPAPIDPLKGNGGRATSDKPPTDPAEYRKWRAKHMKG